MARFFECLSYGPLLCHALRLVGGDEVDHAYYVGTHSLPHWNVQSWVHTFITTFCCMFLQYGCDIGKMINTPITSEWRFSLRHVCSDFLILSHVRIHAHAHAMDLLDERTYDGIWVPV